MGVGGDRPVLGIGHSPMQLKHRTLERPAGSDAGKISRINSVKRLSGHCKVFGIYPRMTFLGEHYRVSCSNISGKSCILLLSLEDSQCTLTLSRSWEFMQ